MYTASHFENKYDSLRLRAKTFVRMLWSAESVPLEVGLGYLSSDWLGD